MTSAKKISVFAFVSLLVIFASIGFLRKSKLENNFVLATGHIYEFGNSRGSGNTIFFKYRFSVDGQIFFGTTGLPCDRVKRLNFQSWTNGRQVQLVYDETNPNNSHLLLSEADYKKYGVTIQSEYSSQIDLIDSLCFQRVGTNN